VEEELNNHLNVFAENYAYVYGGVNDIKTQIGFDSKQGWFKRKFMTKPNSQKFYRKIPIAR